MFQNRGLVGRIQHKLLQILCFLEKPEKIHGFPFCFGLIILKYWWKYSDLAFTKVFKFYTKLSSKWWEKPNLLNKCLWFCKLPVFLSFFFFLALTNNIPYCDCVCDQIAFLGLTTVERTNLTHRQRKLRQPVSLRQNPFKWVACIASCLYCITYNLIFTNFVFLVVCSIQTVSCLCLELTVLL